MKRSVIALGTLALLGLPAACSESAQNSARDAGAAGSAAIDAADAAGEGGAPAPSIEPSSPECGDLPEGTTPMAYLPEEGFCIDRTEVTQRQYQRWLDSGPQVPELPDVCSEKTSFAPPPVCLEDVTGCGSGCEDHPQVCVDWCDAHAYCRAMGKRLCGAIGGGPTPFDQSVDPDVSQWMAACSSGGQHMYPYGDEYDPNACNSGETQPLACLEKLECETVPAGSMASCQSPEPGYQGVYDLVGNVDEWVDSCQGEDTAGHCRYRGSSMAADHDWDDDCGFGSDALPRITFWHYHRWDIGVRCCRDVSL